ncbi:hypothetical protein ASPCAL08448 [Aspergillus calidoustus]|uniref:BZIP domain-containing protein n=1 Tax=Aspergillus calidoustus TaxID=454130 RepID=A0A0U5HJR5_ASPCI|nr:hypothetical protein ASPCAL08448 [Aspergillus calidoustus]
MPAKRGSGDMAVPDITDAAERKRVLNVLAQRRYRKRKKDRLQSLQAQVEKQAKAAEGKAADSTTNPQIILTETLQPLPDGLDSSETVFDPAILNDLDLAVPDIAPSPTFLSMISTPDPSQAFAMPQILANDDPFAYLSSSTAQFSEALNPTDPNQLMFWPTPHSTAINAPLNLSDQLQTYQSSTFTFPDDHTLEIPSLRLLNAAVKVALRLNVAHLLWDLTATSPFYRSQSQNSVSLSLSPPSLTSSSSSSSSPSASASASTPPPPTHAQATQIDPQSLPAHLRPTPTQLLLPHHPLLDILPWPSTRDKLIQIFNLPVELRPEAAQDPMSLMHLAYDMEDESGEGVRVRGDDVFEVGAWEIGNVVFRRWWWAFDSVLLDRWNRARRGRGQGGLVVEVGSEA